MQNESVSKANRTKNTLSPCHTNVRSMKQNLGAFENYMQLLDHQFTIIVFTETWLQDDSHNLYGLKGYLFIGNHRVDKTAGSVAICLEDHIDYTKRSDLSHISDDIRVRLHWNCEWSDAHKKYIIIGVIYRPPNSDMGGSLHRKTQWDDSH